jgi:glucose-6-phosphate-specific signal transduction histidine kinase
MSSNLFGLKVAVE